LAGILEHWNVGKDDKKRRNDFELLKPNIPSFHHSIIPEIMGYRLPPEVWLLRH
jgi:hypothetical protein